jgi:hypothetical protein
MKQVIKCTQRLSRQDVKQAIGAGWALSFYNKKLCLENAKVIFVPVYVAKP